MPKSINTANNQLQQLIDLYDETTLNHERMDWLCTLLSQIHARIKELPEHTGKHKSYFFILSQLTEIADYLAGSFSSDQQEKSKQLEQQIAALEGKQ